jgi:hypothetical protein
MVVSSCMISLVEVIWSVLYNGIGFLCFVVEFKHVYDVAVSSTLILLVVA